MSKPKSTKQSIEDLNQNINQLKLNLEAAHNKNNTKLIKDISRAITGTELLIKRLKGVK